MSRKTIFYILVVPFSILISCKDPEPCPQTPDLEAVGTTPRITLYKCNSNEEVFSLEFEIKAAFVQDSISGKKKIQISCPSENIKYRYNEELFVLVGFFNSNSTHSDRANFEIKIMISDGNQLHIRGTNFKDEDKTMEGRTGGWQTNFRFYGEIYVNNSGELATSLEHGYRNETGFDFLHRAVDDSHAFELSMN